MWDRLTEDEQNEIASWHVPKTVRIGDVELRYEDANKEIPLGLTESGAFCPKGSPNAMTEGTVDIYWALARTVYVVDMKRSEYTTVDGPKSLQIKGYALAVAALHEPDGIDSYVTGVFSLETGEYEWDELTHVESERAAEDWRRVKAAALHIEGDYSTGKHCRQCWQRSKCPAYLMPPGTTEESLVPFVTGELTQEKALELLQLKERVATTMKRADEILKAYADEHGGIRDEADGTTWKALMMPGRRGLDTKRLEKDHPQLVETYTKWGAPYPQYRWLKDKK